MHVAAPQLGSIAAPSKVGRKPAPAASAHLHSEIVDVAVQGVREQGRQRMLQQLLLLWEQLQTRGMGQDVLPAAGL